MPLPVVPLDSPNEKQHRTVIATSLNELVKFYNTIREGSWTVAIRGSGTAGTYEIASQNCRYTRIGRRVWLDVDLTMAAAVTGGGTGYLQMTGAPFTKAANTRPCGSVRTSGVDIAAGAHISLAFIALSATSVLYIFETNDNAATTDLQVAGLAANDVITGSICYETDDP